LVGLEPERLAALAAELGQDHPWFEADVTDQASLDAAVAGTVEKLGGIDVVVANAGIAPYGTLAGGDPDAFALCVDVNLTGVIRTVRASAAEITKSRGYFLLISSVSAFSAVPTLGVYAATKAGVESLGNTLRVELGDAGVGVGVAHPGWLDTDLVRDVSDEYRAFEIFRENLPWPVKKVTPLDRGIAALVNGIEKRKTRIYVPRSMALVRRTRRTLTSRFGERILRRGARPAFEILDRETAEQGSLSRRNRQIERQ
jgi:NAD(P)-dependent dehydrogenase (short-subunit alcohol dehydrogenase family)